MDVNKTYEEKTWQQLHKNAASNIEESMEAACHKEAAVRLPTTHHENYLSYTNKNCRTLLENGDELISDIFLYTPSHW